MKNENSSTTILLTFNIVLVILGLFMINNRILNTDEKSDSLKQKINQIESQLDVLIDDTKTANEQVIVANKDFIQLSNSMAVNDKILKKLLHPLIFRFFTFFIISKSNISLYLYRVMFFLSVKCLICSVLI